MRILKVNDIDTPPAKAGLWFKRLVQSGVINWGPAVVQLFKERACVPHFTGQTKRVAAGSSALLLSGQPEAPSLTWKHPVWASGLRENGLLF